MHQKYKNKNQSIKKNQKIKINCKTKEQKKKLEVIIALYNLRTDLPGTSSKKTTKQSEKRKSNNLQ